MELPFDPKGGLAYQINVTAPDGSPANLAETAAADTDGTVLLRFPMAIVMAESWS